MRIKEIILATIAFILFLLAKDIHDIKNVKQKTIMDWAEDASFPPFKKGDKFEIKIYVDAISKEELVVDETYVITLGNHLVSKVSN